MKKVDIIDTINTRIGSMYSQLPAEKQERFSARLHRLGEEFMSEIVKELGPSDSNHLKAVPVKVAKLAEDWERIFQRICSSEVVTGINEAVESTIIGEAGIDAIDKASTTIARESVEASGP